MATHLSETIKACDKCFEEAKKLDKQFKAAKTKPEKEKLQKMADAARKMGVAYYNMIDAAKDKDKKEMLDICDSIIGARL